MGSTFFPEIKQIEWPKMPVSLLLARILPTHCGHAGSFMLIQNLNGQWHFSLWLMNMGKMNQWCFLEWGREVDWVPVELFLHRWGYGYCRWWNYWSKLHSSTVEELAQNSRLLTLVPIFLPNTMPTRAQHFTVSKVPLHIPHLARQTLFFPLCRWEYWGSERLTDLHRFNQLTNRRKILCHLHISFPSISWYLTYHQ